MYAIKVKQDVFLAFLNIIGHSTGFKEIIKKNLNIWLILCITSLNGEFKKQILIKNKRLKQKLSTNLY